MEKIYKVSQIPKSLPKAVVERLIKDIMNMNCWYGSDRDINSEGGFFYVIQDEKDNQEVLSVWSLDNPSVIPEVVELIGDTDYYRVLVIAGAEYHVIFYIRKNLAPKRILKYELSKE